MIEKYLEAIDIAAERETRTIEIQVHQGYRATLERYLRDSTMLDVEELWAILSLYSIDNLPPVPAVEFDEIIITYMPQGRVLMSGQQPGIIISFIPQGRVHLQGVALQLTYIPQGRVLISGISARITFVPQGRVSLILPVVLTHVPQGRVKLSGLDVVLTHVPQGRVKLGAEDDLTITYLPQGRVIIVDGTLQRVYHGIILGAQSVRPVGAEVDFNTLTEDTYSTVGSELSIRYATNVSGWMVFALPESAAMRISWYQDENNQGAIGGPASPVNMANFWPDPEIKEHNGVSYRLYVSKMRSQAAGDGLYLIRDYKPT